MQLEKYLEVPTPNIMCGHMIRKRGRGHILGSCYAVVKILRSTYATNVMLEPGTGDFCKCSDDIGAAVCYTIFTIYPSLCK